MQRFACGTHTPHRRRSPELPRELLEAFERLQPDVILDVQLPDLSGFDSIFATLPIIDMKEMGIGLAAAVLIDATLVRGVLLPATMRLLGDWNWYLPRWLEWLPRVEHETEAKPGEAALAV